MNDVTWTDARLHRLGRRPWTELQTLLTGAHCAWADLSGFHVEPATALPGAPAGITHLWAWSVATCWRIRVDRSSALVAGLDLADGAGTPDTVRVRTRPGSPWGEDDEQVARQHTAAHALGFELLEVTGPTPVTFVRGKVTVSER